MRYGEMSEQDKKGTNIQRITRSEDRTCLFHYSFIHAGCILKRLGEGILNFEISAFLSV